MYLSAISYCSFVPIRLNQPWPACMARTMFSRTVRSAMMPSTFRSSGQSAIAAGDGRGRREIPDRLAVHDHRAGVRPVDAEEQVRHLGATRAQQAGETHDLARVERQVEGFDRASRDPSPRLRASGSAAMWWLLSILWARHVVEVRDAATEHQADQLESRQGLPSGTCRRARRSAGPSPGRKPRTPGRGSG